VIARIEFKPGEIPVVKPEPPPEPAKPDPSIKAEANASGILDIAKEFIRDGKPEKAAERLKKIISEYPDTKAAKEAAELLKKVEAK
jgi:TolA-binding protein